MSAQLSFEGFEPQDRLFFALYPHADAASRFTLQRDHLCREQRLKGKPIASRRHGSCAVIRRRLRSGLDVLSGTGDTIIVMLGGDGVEPLKRFQQALSDSVARTTLHRWSKPAFTPHVTLLYGNEQLAEQGVEPVAWTASEFVLVHSLIGQTKHVVIGRWPLLAGDRV